MSFLERAKFTTGQEFNNLTVIKYSHIKRTNAYWKCKCICGNITTATSSELTNGYKRAVVVIEHLLVN